MVTFPNAKINLGLRVLRKRSDGYHDIETCFFPVPDLFDVLEITPAREATELEVVGSDWQGSVTENLVFKAYQLFAAHEPKMGQHKFHLIKSIPSGAGLGGGSSDAAFALKMLAKLYGWAPTDPRLHHMALSLGSDCPFFLLNRPCLAFGRGEILTPISLDLSAYRFEFVFPGISVSTAQAYGRIVPSEAGQELKEILSSPVEQWKDALINDFEIPVFQMYPELKEAKQALYDKGAVYAAMSGSGSTLFGLFRKE